jgi:hypothetical protein
MSRRGPALALCLVLVLSGCTRVVDDAKPQAEQPVAPIAAGQVRDLLSKKVQKGNDGNLFVTVTPERCAGLAREVDPPFITDAKPAASDGGHWSAGDGGVPSIEEMVGVYRANFDPGAAVAKITRAIESCRSETLTVTALKGEVIHVSLHTATDSGSSQIALWSFSSSEWACDNAFVAAHNAAVEITTCSTVGGYDVESLARDALNRIDALVNTVA